MSFDKDITNEKELVIDAEKPIEKVAFIRKEKGKWCVKSEKGKSMGCYETKAEAKKRLRQIEFFKHKKGELLNRMNYVADEIDRRVDVYVGDTLTDCISAISSDNFEFAPIKLMKLGNLLDRKGFFDLAEDVDAFIPDVLELKINFSR